MEVDPVGASLRSDGADAVMPVADVMAAMEADDADAVMPIVDVMAAMDVDDAHDLIDSGLPIVPHGTGGIAAAIGDGCGFGRDSPIVGDLIAAIEIISPIGHHGYNHPRSQSPCSSLCSVPPVSSLAAGSRWRSPSGAL